MRVVTLKGFTCIQLCGVANIATLGIQDDGNSGVGVADVFTHPLELRFSALGSEVRNLWFERTGILRSGIDNGNTKLGKRVGLTCKLRWQTRHIRVEPHAQHGATVLPALL